jgi:MFS family permease
VRNILQHRGLRLIFAANVISMIGSGMNSAAVTWYVLQKTHSEASLGMLLMLQTIPVLIMLPFSGVFIDRQDRRKLLMTLDAVRAVIIVVVAVLAYRGVAQLWQVYLMSIMVAAGFWMFWPTITALIQELSPESKYTHANSFLIAGVQGGWLIAGSMVGFVYNSIGLAGVLFIDFASYLLSFTCYLLVRKGHHTVMVEPAEDAPQATVDRFFHELKEGISFIRVRPQLLLMGTCWALFIGAMLTQGVITAPFSDRILQAGAIGYGWLNGGWAIGAFMSAMYTPALIRGTGHRRAVGVAMTTLGCSLMLLPLVGAHVHGRIALGSAAMSAGLLVSVMVYCAMGCGRALGGVAITSTIMEMVPKHFMGRVQNTFYFAGTCLQLFLSLAVGAVSHHKSLALGFCMVGSLYLLAAVFGSWPVASTQHSAVSTQPLDHTESVVH